MRKCKKCGEIYNDESVRFCKKCGGEVGDEVCYCTKCGKKLSIDEKYCSACGEKNIRNISNAVNDKSDKKGLGFTIRKKHIIPVVSVFAFLMLLFIGIFIKINGYNNYISNYEKKVQAYDLGSYKDEYNQKINMAKKVGSSFEFWKISEQKNELESLFLRIKEMNEKVHKYKKIYDGVIAELENSGKYYIPDEEENYKEKYDEIKTRLKKALDSFDEVECKNISKEFSDIRDKVIEYNEDEGEQEYNDVQDIDYNDENDYKSCEIYLLSKLKEKIEQNYKKEEFVKEKKEYMNFCKNQEIFDNAIVMDDTSADFVQGDVSQDGIIKLYYKSEDNNEEINPDNVLVYEKDDKEWRKCNVESLCKIQDREDIYIDLVADVSTSMEENFTDMQGAVEEFVDGTNDNTYLGLMQLSSGYTRMQDFTSNKELINDKVYNLQCEGCTALYATLYASVNYTSTAKGGAKCVVAFTDGKNETDNLCTENDVIDLAKQYNIPIYIVGIGEYVDDNVLREICESTGGEYYEGYDVSGLYDVYNEIYENQKQMYQLTYDTEIPFDNDREVYVCTNNSESDTNFGIHYEDELETSVLSGVYDTGISGDNLLDYFTEKKISQEEMDNLDIYDLQILINVYCAKYGYKLKDKTVKEIQNKIPSFENGSEYENGLSGQEKAVEKMKKKSTRHYHNYVALYCARDNIIYNYITDAYYENENMSKDELFSKVREKIGGSNPDKFSLETQYKKFIEGIK